MPDFEMMNRKDLHLLKVNPNCYKVDINLSTKHTMHVKIVINKDII